MRNFVFDRQCNGKILSQELISAGLAGRFYGISTSDDQATVHGYDDLTDEEKDLISEIVYAHVYSATPEPNWATFNGALMTSALGQRILGATPIGGYLPALCAALAINSEAQSTYLMNKVAVDYSFTAGEKAYVNALISTFHVPITPLA